jgi:transposase-like protein
LLARPYFADEAAAWELMESLRWPDGPVCPHCGVVDQATFLTPRDGQRTTSTGNVSFRRTWKCQVCHKKFSVLVGSIFEGSKVPLRKWLAAFYMLTANKNGVAAYEIHRTLAVTNKTAWFMMHRIREAMKSGVLGDMLRGTIVADETYIGGNPKRMNAKTRKRWEGWDQEPELVQSGAGRPSQKTAKTPVFTMINPETGVAHSDVVANVDGATLGKVMAEHVNMGRSHLQTDAGSWYGDLGKKFLTHRAVNHKAGEYVRNGASTNKVENYFSQLKRSIDGTHHHVSVEHLPRYLAEFDFRYSTCKLTDSERMERLMGQTGGKRLTYRAAKSRSTK